MESGVEISGRVWGGWGPHAEGRTDGVRLGRCPVWRLVGVWLLVGNRQTLLVSHVMGRGSERFLMFLFSCCKNYALILLVFLEFFSFKVTFIILDKF